MTGKNADNVQRRIQFLNKEDVTSGDTFTFAVQRGINTVFATGAFRTEFLMGDENIEDPSAEWVAISTDGESYDFDGTLTNIRVLTGPGHYRLVATATDTGVSAGVSWANV